MKTKKNSDDARIEKLEAKAKRRGMTLPKVSQDVKHCAVYVSYLKEVYGCLV